MLHRPWARMTRPASLLVATALIASACTSAGAGSSPSSAATAAPASQAPVASSAPSTEPIGGSLTVYNAQHESLTQAWVDEFTKQTGVQVTLRNGDDSELGNLLVQEGDASPADVFLTENSPAMALVENAGLFAPVDQATLDQVPAEYRPSTGAWTGIAARSTVFAYNPTLLTADQLPASLLDLQNAEWKGRWAASPGGADFQAIVGALLALKGEAATEAWLAGMKTNFTAYQGNTTVMKAVNAGEIPGGVIYHYYWFGDQAKTKENSKNVTLHYFKKQDPGAFVSISGGGVLKSSKNAGGRPGPPEVHHRGRRPDDPADRRFVRVRHRQRRRGEPGPAAAGRARSADDRPIDARQQEGHRPHDTGRDPLTMRGPALAEARPHDRRMRLHLRRPGGASGERLPVVLLVPAVAVSVAALIPLALRRVHHGPDRMGPVAELIFRPRVFELFASTMALLLFTIPACVALGVGAAWLVERTDLPGRRVWAVLLAAPARRAGLRHELRLDHDLPVTGRVGGRSPGRDALLLPVDLPAGRRHAPASRPRPRGGRRQPGSQPAPGLPRRVVRRSSGCRSSVAGCSSVCTCWPSTAPSRCSASIPSRPRSSSSTAPRSTARPPRRWPACSSSAASRCSCSRTPRAATAGTRGSGSARPGRSVAIRLGRMAAAGRRGDRRAGRDWPSACRCSASPAGSGRAGSAVWTDAHLVQALAQTAALAAGGALLTVVLSVPWPCSSSASARGPAGRSRRPTT